MDRIETERRPGNPRRGSAMILVTVMLATFFTLSMSYMVMTSSGYAEQRQSRDQLQAFYVAEGGLREVLAVLAEGGRTAVDNEIYPKENEGTSYTVTTVWGDSDPGLGDDLVRFRCDAEQNSQSFSLELLCRNGSAPVDLWRSGVFSKKDMTLKSNVIVDSYDSSAGTYASQATHSFHGVSYADTSVPVSSNGDISLDSNAAIMGDGNPGPSGSVSISGGSHVAGSTTPLPSAVSLPPITVPSFPSSGSISLSSGTRNIAPGDYRYSKIEMDSVGILNIEGPATVVVGDFYVDSNSEIRIDATNGPVQLYVTGSFDIKSNAIVGPISADPAGLEVFVDGNGPDLLLDSNAEFTGTIYAPKRYTEIKSNSHVWGALAVEELFLDSNAMVHFDENLVAGSGGGGSGAPTILCWRRL